MVETEGKFSIVRFEGTETGIGLPSWQVMLSAEDPVILLADSTEVPSSPDTLPEEVLVDRAERSWDEGNHFAVDRVRALEIAWFDAVPEVPTLSKVVLVLRPNKVLDEDYNKELWQLDE
jgi:hypothetical protein